MSATELQEGEVVIQDGDMTKHYLSLTQFAQRIGVQRGAMTKYKLPKPDVTVGDVRGWSEKTIDDWNEQRPGRGGKWEKDPSKGR